MYHIAFLQYKKKKKKILVAFEWHAILLNNGDTSYYSKHHNTVINRIIPRFTTQHITIKYTKKIYNTYLHSRSIS